jgi:hypothetical protein
VSVYLQVKPNRQTTFIVSSFIVQRVVIETWLFMVFIMEWLMVRRTWVEMWAFMASIM